MKVMFKTLVTRSILGLALFTATQNTCLGSCVDFDIEGAFRAAHKRAIRSTAAAGASAFHALSAVDAKDTAALTLSPSPGTPILAPTPLRTSAHSCLGSEFLPESFLEAARDYANLTPFQELWNSGANIDATDKEGFNALHIAMREGNCDVVNFLKQRITDLEARTIAGDSAIMIGIHHNNVACVQELCKPAPYDTTGEMRTVQTDLITTIDGIDYCALLFAACYGTHEACKALLGHEDCDQDLTTEISKLKADRDTELLANTKLAKAIDQDRPLVLNIVLPRLIWKIKCNRIESITRLKTLVQAK